MKRGNDYNDSLGAYESKLLRDRLKYAYRKHAEEQGCCEICGELNTKENSVIDKRSSTGSLKMVFAYSLVLLWNKWKKENGVVITTKEQMDVLATEFIEAEYDKLHTFWVMCPTHHAKIHSLYGKTVPLHYSKKMIRYVGIQKEKYI